MKIELTDKEAQYLQKILLTGRNIARKNLHHPVVLGVNIKEMWETTIEINRGIANKVDYEQRRRER